jgi:hypothetical protein
MKRRIYTSQHFKLPAKNVGNKTLEYKAGIKAQRGLGRNFHRIPYISRHEIGCLGNILAFDIRGDADDIVRVILNDKNSQL